MSEKIKVIIVDDHNLFRSSLGSVLEAENPDIAVVGKAKSGADFFALLPTVKADIVLLDIVMPDMSGVEVALRLKKEYPEMKILAVSGEDTMDKVKEMVDAGVEGFISKGQGNVDDIAEAIRDIMLGIDYFGRDISDIIRRVYVAKKKTTEITPEFTEYEQRVIKYCLEGLSAKMIAAELGVVPKTVNWHKQKIFDKLGINSTTELMSYMLKKGLFQ